MEQSTGSFRRALTSHRRHATVIAFYLLVSFRCPAGYGEARRAQQYCAHSEIREAVKERTVELDKTNLNLRTLARSDAVADDENGASPVSYTQRGRCWRRWE